MMEDLQKQAERFGSRLIFEDATSVDLVRTALQGRNR